MKKANLKKKLKSVRKSTPKLIAKFKRPKYFIPLFAVIGVLGLAISSAYSIRTQSKVINTTNCSPSSSIRCYDGAAVSNSSILFNGGSTANPGNAATGKFYIVGNQIVDPDGKVFVPMGANGGVAPGWTFGLHGKFNGKVNEVKGWGWNTIRANVVCENNNGLNGPDKVANQRDFYKGMDDLIAEYTSQKVVVMIECHDQTGKNPTDITANEYAFWEHIAANHKNNPYVWFNFVNEPYEEGDQTSVNSWLALQTKLYNWLRERSPDSIFVADLPRYGQGAESLKGTNGSIKLKEGRCNVLYGWHNYGAMTGVDSYNQAASRSAQLDLFNYFRDNKIAVVLGELGDPLTLEEGTAGAPIWNRYGAFASFDYAPERGVGILWWSATGDSNIWVTYSLTADRSSPWKSLPNGTNLSTAGQRFWNISKSGHSQTKFTGNVADSGCASAR